MANSFSAVCHGSPADKLMPYQTNAGYARNPFFSRKGAKIAKEGSLVQNRVPVLHNTPASRLCVRIFLFFMTPVYWKKIHGASRVSGVSLSKLHKQQPPFFRLGMINF